MADVHLMNVFDGARQTWAAAGAAVTSVIPVSRVYFHRLPEGVVYPACTITVKDVSAYFGGTTYFSGARYVKVQQITFTIYCLPTTDLSSLLTALADALGWSSTDPNGVWIIPNAVGVLSAMPETDTPELLNERIDGQDIIKWPTTYTITLECDRG